MIDRAEAVRIAETEIVTRGLGTGVTGIYSAKELGSRRLNIYYNCPDLRSCWIAYAARPLIGLRSSTVVLVSRFSGKVLFCGSAHDEG